MKYYVIAESNYNEDQILTLTPYRKNKRTNYKFTTNLSNSASFKNPQIAKNYGNRATRLLSFKVVDEIDFNRIATEEKDRIGHLYAENSYGLDYLLSCGDR
jgi:hypothetical protein